MAKRKIDLLSADQLQSHTVDIFEAIAKTDNLSQIQITEATGIHRTTLSSLLPFLDESGWLVAKEESSQGRGRPKTLWGFDPNAGNFLVVIPGIQHTYTRILDFCGSIVQEDISDPIFDIKQLETHVIGVIAQHPRLLGVLVGVSGVVQSDQGIIALSERWQIETYPFIQNIRSACESDCYLGIENISSLGGLGEQVPQFTTNPNEHFMCLQIQRGISPPPHYRGLGFGCALILNGKLFSGGHSSAGEIDPDQLPTLMKVIRKDATITELSHLSSKALRDVAHEMGLWVSRHTRFLALDKVILQYVEETPNEAFTKAFTAGLQQGYQSPGLDSASVVVSEFEACEAALEGAKRYLIKSCLGQSGFRQHLARRIFSG